MAAEDTILLNCHNQVVIGKLFVSIISRYNLFHSRSHSFFLVTTSAISISQNYYNINKLTSKIAFAQMDWIKHKGCNPSSLHIRTEIRVQKTWTRNLKECRWTKLPSFLLGSIHLCRFLFKRFEKNGEYDTGSRSTFELPRRVNLSGPSLYCTWLYGQD